MNESDINVYNNHVDATNLYLALARPFGYG
jgi:hypothetical protein